VLLRLLFTSNSAFFVGAGSGYPCYATDYVMGALITS